MFKMLTLAIAIATAAADIAPAHADFPITTNGLSANGFTSNGLSSNAVEAPAALNGRVIGIELPPATREVN